MRSSLEIPGIVGAALFLAGAVAASSALADDEKLDLSKSASISCDTSAVILDANPFEASQGEISIDLQLDDPAEDQGPGRWKVSEAPGDHEASFVGGTKESCIPDCPFTQGKDGTLQLWSPKPLALSQLDEKTALVLVTINKKSLELKASMFRNKEMAGLERGECKLVGEDSSTESEADSSVKESDKPESTPADAEPADHDATEKAKP